MNWPMLFKMFCVVLFAFGAGFWCAYTVYFQKPKSGNATVATEREAVTTQVGSWPDGKLVEYRSPAMRAPAVFRGSDGGGYPPMHKWGDLPYEEIAPMFLDQFLLRYFSKTFYVAIYPSLGSDSPWSSFCAHNVDAHYLPILFQQLTGYELTDRQLNWAIDEYMSRLQRAQAGKSQSAEIIEQCANSPKA